MVFREYHIYFTSTAENLIFLTSALARVRQKYLIVSIVPYE